ncbi:MAG: hypothetical protein KBD53_00525 [Candidatus Omnitrophica bacterium]|nr:hypothetical protein [Candidatus Omnitrophota bacterium]
MDDQTLITSIKKAVQDLELDLSGRIVLTEAANGPYCVTPLIAAVAGAKVYAVGRTTAYGTTSDIFSELNQRLKLFNLDNVQMSEYLSAEIIHQADIITNSGHLRPLDEDKLQHVKKGCVVALMYEAWEIREDDLDLDYCQTWKIPVAAVNERHPLVGVFDYLGDMAVELIRRAGLTVENNTFMLICNNDFGPYIARTIVQQGGRLGVIDSPRNRAQYDSGEVWLTDRLEDLKDDTFHDCQAVIFTAYPFNQIWISDRASIPVDQLKKQFPNAVLLRFAGDVDTRALDREGIRYFPQDVKSGHMGILPSDIGYEPVIRLQAGGLKAAQAFLENRMTLNNEIICTIV